MHVPLYLKLPKRGKTPQKKIISRFCSPLVTPKVTPVGCGDPVGATTPLPCHHGPVAPLGHPRGTQNFGLPSRRGHHVSSSRPRWPRATEGLGPGRAPSGAVVACPLWGVFLAGRPGTVGRPRAPWHVPVPRPSPPHRAARSSKFTRGRSSDITRLEAMGWQRGGVTPCF